MKVIAAALCLGSLTALARDAAPGLAADAPRVPVTTVAAVDLQRYMGTWYEIAKFPNWFQKKCRGQTKADYSIRADGRVQVINRCRVANGEFNEALGVARQIGAASSPKLEVRFAPAWLSFVPVVWGDYWIIDLDERYQLAAVSEPKKDYLWILSRTTKVDPASYDALLGRLVIKGFDIQKLELTQQE